MRVTIRKRVNTGDDKDGVQGEGEDKGKSKNDVFRVKMQLKHV